MQYVCMCVCMHHHAHTVFEGSTTPRSCFTGSLRKSFSSFSRSVRSCSHTARLHKRSEASALRSNAIMMKRQRADIEI